MFVPVRFRAVAMNRISCELDINRPSFESIQTHCCCYDIPKETKSPPDKPKRQSVVSLNKLYVELESD